MSPERIQVQLDLTKHDRLRKFAAGKGVRNMKKPKVDLELSPRELRSLERKMTRYGVTGGIKAKTAVKAPSKPQDAPEPPEAPEVPGDGEDAESGSEGPKRRRRSQ